MSRVDELNEHELIELARADETELGRIIAKLSDLELADLMRRIEDNPRINTELVNEDFRCQIGERRGLKRFSKWVKEARDKLSKPNRGDQQP